MKIPAAVRAYGRDARDAFEHAPLEVLTGVATALAFSLTVRSHDEEEFVRVAAAAGLMLPLLFALSVLRGRRLVGAGARWTASAAVVLGAAAFALWGLDPDRESTLWRWACLLGVSVLALSLVPLPGRADGEDPRMRFWAFNVRVLGRTVSVGLYAAALFAALAGAVAAVSSLFELKTPDHLYLDLAGAVFFALTPWVIVGGLPSLVELPREEKAPVAVRWLGRSLYVPVVVVYLAILVAYTAKVLVTGELPKNLLSPIVLMAALFGFLGALFVEPLVRDPAHPAIARVVRGFPAVLLFLLPVAMRAVWIRQGDYGWTEFRFIRFLLLVAFFVLAAWGAYRLLRKGLPLLVEIPAVLGAALLLGAVLAGPVSRMDQQARLRAALARVGVMEGGRLARPLPPPDRVSAEERRTVPQHEFERIQGALVYLHESHGPGAVRAVLGPGADAYTTGWAAAGALPIEPGCEPDRASRYGVLALGPGAGLPVAAGGTLYRLDRQGRPVGGPADTASAVWIELESAAVRVHSRAPRWTARVELRPLLDLFATRDPCRPAELPPLAPAQAVHPLVDEAGRARGQLFLTQVGFDPAPDGERGPPSVLSHVSAMVVVADSAGG